MARQHDDNPTARCTACQEASTVGSGRSRIFWIDPTPSASRRTMPSAIPLSVATDRQLPGAVAADPLGGPEAFVGFASGIADHLNDLLMGIQGWVSVLRMDLPMGSNRWRQLRRMDAAIHHGALRILQLLSLAGRGVFASPIASIARSTTFVGYDHTLVLDGSDTGAMDALLNQYRHMADSVQPPIPLVCRAVTLDFADFFIQLERFLPHLAEYAADRHINALGKLVDRGKRFLRQLYRVSSATVVRHQRSSMLDTAANAAIERWRHSAISRPDIVIENRTAAADVTISATTAQVSGLITTLLQNASDAMPAGGTIRLETMSVMEPGSTFGADGLPEAGAYARIAVTDTGHGMDSITMTHMFSPFYSTRIRKDRLGVGLSALYARVKALNGYIHVLSRLGQGTSVVVLLPQAPSMTTAVPLCPPVWDGVCKVSHVVAATA